ncbi:hypothetical protein B0A55_11770 [Friedmanniomyces simplex]|uniref:Uncharacterized protein n=1 Tax=Friedmanniomyces simplex TaxID=329884 RepID=A0A4V5ND42_9PEZI|nr:hypothetical protein B0A55_11770 [Friedmanniomyces simplex]
MASRQDITTPYVLANKPSSSFSTVSSAASATSAATSRSGGSKLLFGEIDLSSDRSSESYASVCSFVLSDSGTFLKFWLEDKCRDTFLSHLPKDDLASLRLVGHDFGVRAAPALFSDLSITFKTGTFTRPARLAALDRLGFYVKTLRFTVPHTHETFLPPLVEPDTGEELSFTYTPQVTPCAGRPKYGDIGTTEILTRQYPALFHAATNVPAFVRAFSAFINLQHLHVRCPGRPEHLKLLQNYLRNFQNNLTTFDFQWLGAAGPLPVQQPEIPASAVREPPANRVGADARAQRNPPPQRAMPLLRFPRLKKFKFKNIATPAADIQSFARSHKQTVEELDLEDTELTAGTWDEALSPLTRQARRRTSHACIPIMLSPTTLTAPPLAPMERVDSYITSGGRPSMRLSKWFPGRRSKPATPRKVKEGLLGREGQLKKVLGGVLAWK